VQEAINNSIKHANANIIDFETNDSLKPNHVTLVISDNGVGFRPDAGTDGKGLSGMRRRAAAVGVGLEILSSAAGTSIQIDIPNVRFSSTRPAGIESRP
jgi:signal transduction histidine kinase